MHLKLTLAYDGTRFRGWARQPGERTVEGVVTDALEGLFYDAPARLAVAGRTDTGVHALANVVSVEVTGGPPAERAMEALNAVLPYDVAVVRAEEVAPEFHARHSARSRSYRYRIWRRRERSPFEVDRSIWHPRPLDLQRLQAIGRDGRRGARLPRVHPDRDPAQGLRPRRSRTPAGTTAATRSSSRSPPNSFLRHMVRTLVGTMLVLDPDEFLQLLQGAPRSAAGTTAPACGLYLVSVGYPSA